MQLHTILLMTLTISALTFTTMYYHNNNNNSSNNSSNDNSYMYNNDNNKKEYYKEYAEFRKNNNKMYNSTQELEYRYSIFVNNMQRIKKHNETDSTYKLGITQFTDLTWSEFKDAYLTYETQNTEYTTEGEIMQNVDTIDWREQNVVSKVKNQGMCGSCWAFSTTGSMESYIAITTKKLLDLSEQELVDCSRSYGNYGCNGGLMTSAYNYIKEHKLGIEKDYAYTARTQKCKRKETGERYVVSKYEVLSRGNVNVQKLSEMLQKGPVSVAIEVRSDFQLYHSGIYAFKKGCGRALNHGVLLVGQKDNYYIVKNSWGEAWGMKGYIQMEIGSGSGNCGIANTWDVLPVSA